MEKIVRQRNGIVELMRFLFCLLVVGFHIQINIPDKFGWFTDGALAVEFYFVLSGLLLAKSLEKIHAAGKDNAISDSLKQIWRKLKPILPVHFIAIGAMLIVIAVLDSSAFTERLVAGIPSIFLLNMIPVWSDSFAKALITPEWYLSAMFLTMLFICPLYLLLRRRMSGVYATLCLLGIIIATVAGAGMIAGFGFPQNFSFTYRAWAELCLGMLVYPLSQRISQKNWNLSGVEIAGYAIPLVMGVLPLPNDALTMGICMALTVILIIPALAITFAGKGCKTENAQLNRTFAMLGRWSVPIYIFHPVLIELVRLAING